MYGIWNIATQRFLIGICERTKAEAEAKYIAKYPIASTLLEENHGINTLQQKGW